MYIFPDSSIKSYKVDKIECPLVSMDNAIYYKEKTIYDDQKSPKIIPINYALTYHNGNYYFFIYDIPSDRTYFVSECEEFTSMKVFQITNEHALNIMENNGAYSYWETIFNGWTNYLHYYIFVGNEIHNKIIRFDLTKNGDVYNAPRGHCPAHFDFNKPNNINDFLSNHKKEYLATKLDINPCGYREYLINKLI